VDAHPARTGIRRLREECAAAGKAELFDALRIYLSGAKSGGVLWGSGCAVEHDRRRGAGRGAPLRRRYGELLREEIAHTVSEDREIDEEIRSSVRGTAG